MAPSSKLPSPFETVVTHAEAEGIVPLTSFAPPAAKRAAPAAPTHPG
jgi:hypothetical protein